MNQDVLNYENKIISVFLQKRNTFIHTIGIINFNDLSNEKLNVCIDDIKEVIDSVKIACDNIDHFLLNNQNNFNNTDTIDKRKNMQEIITTYYFFRELFLPTVTSSESESVNDSDSESNSEPESLIESLVESVIESELE